MSRITAVIVAAGSAWLVACSAASSSSPPGTGTTTGGADASSTNTPRLDAAATGGTGMSSGGTGGAGTGGTASGGAGGQPALAGRSGTTPPKDAGVSGAAGGAGVDASAPPSSSDTSSPPPPTSGCGAGGFCTDFEAAQLPSGLTFFPDYQRANASKFVTLDDTVAHAGKRSLKVSGTDFSQMLGVATPGPAFWARVYLRSDTKMQQGHNTYVLATPGNGDPNMGEAIRIGEHQCQLELNRKSDDKEKLSNGGQYMCSGGVVFEANTWYCLEAFFDGPGKTVRVSVDGKEIDALAVTDFGPYDYKLFKLGFEKYHGGAKTLWYDDLAVTTARTGCK